MGQKLSRKPLECLGPDFSRNYSKLVRKLLRKRFENQFIKGKDETLARKNGDLSIKNSTQTCQILLGKPSEYLQTDIKIRANLNENTR